MLLLCAGNCCFIVCSFSMGLHLLRYIVASLLYLNLCLLILFFIGRATLLPAIKRYLPKHWNDDVIVWRFPYFRCMSSSPVIYYKIIGLVSLLVFFSLVPFKSNTSLRCLLLLTDSVPYAMPDRLNFCHCTVAFPCETL